MPRTAPYGKKQEWRKYQEWFHKQEAKGFAMKPDAAIIADSYQQYEIQRAYLKDKLKGKGVSVLQEMKRTSYLHSAKQTSMFVQNINRALEEGDTEVVKKLAEFGITDKLDVQDAIYRGMKDKQKINNINAAVSAISSLGVLYAYNSPS